jgi:hypothetical protein
MFLSLLSWCRSMVKWGKMSSSSTPQQKNR